MNGPLDRHEAMQGVAAELDGLEHLPDDELHHAVTRDGSCMVLYRLDCRPEWSGDDMTDREVAARICAGCPVQRECLELELRTSGDATLGVWGALRAEDVRALHPVWRSRRVDRDVPDDRHVPDGGEGA